MVTEKFEQLLNSPESVDYTLSSDRCRLLVLLRLPRAELMALLGGLSFAYSYVKFLLISLAALPCPNS
jgi:hypothetical protein